MLFQVCRGSGGPDGKGSPTSAAIPVCEGGAEPAEASPGTMKNAPERTLYKIIAFDFHFQPRWNKSHQAKMNETIVLITKDRDS